MHADVTRAENDSCGASVPAAVPALIVMVCVSRCYRCGRHASRLMLLYACISEADLGRLGRVACSVYEYGRAIRSEVPKLRRERRTGPSGGSTPS
jgi:hypothetical protein